MDLVQADFQNMRAAPLCGNEMAALMDQENAQVAQEPNQRQHRFAAGVQQYDRRDEKHSPVNVHVNALHAHNTHKGGIPARFRQLHQRWHREATSYDENPAAG
jgi:hypothetical protein